MKMLRDMMFLPSNRCRVCRNPHHSPHILLKLCEIMHTTAEKTRKQRTKACLNSLAHYPKRALDHAITGSGGEQTKAPRLAGALAARSGRL
jgi:pyruvate-formate lyase-activating enzyme